MFKFWIPSISANINDSNRSVEWTEKMNRVDRSIYEASDVERLIDAKIVKVKGDGGKAMPKDEGKRE